MNWRVKYQAPEATQIQFADTLKILLLSDVHFDNPHCNRKLLKKHLDEAKQINAPILSAGDWFCAMQGKWDKRGNKDSILEENSKGNYLDSLVECTADFLAPYAKQFTLFAPGNHETSILKRHETNLTQRLVERVRAQNPESPIYAGNYSGWVKFQWLNNGDENYKASACNLWYHHGYGGGAPVTRGLIQTARNQVYVSNADILWTGHIHNAYAVPIQRIQLSNNMTVIQKRSLHICTAGYKDEYGSGEGGWHIERGGPPKPIGGAWITLSMQRAGSLREVVADYQEAHY